MNSRLTVQQLTNEHMCVCVCVGGGVREPTNYCLLYRLLAVHF